MNLDDDDTVDELPPRPRQVIPSADRELLELAGRALGAVLVEDVDGESWVNLHFNDSPTIFGWNPLLHGDDALILAVKLKLDIMHRVVGGKRVEVVAPKAPVIREFYEDDGVLATRRAVTRAAAEVEKARAGS